MDTTLSTPTMLPPAVTGTAGDGTVGTSAPTHAPDTSGAAATAVQIPQQQPSGATTAGTVAAAGALPGTAVTGTWHTGVTVDGLWYADELRNAWMHLAGIGWKKIFNGTDPAFTALCTLAAQARQTGRTINYREEADGMAHEIYLW